MRESAAVERAVALYCAGNGLTIAAAAEQAGVSRVSLTRALRRRGFPPAPAGRPVRSPAALPPEPYYYADGTLLRVTKPTARRRKP